MYIYIYIYIYTHIHTWPSDPALFLATTLKSSLQFFTINLVTKCSVGTGVFI